MNSFLHKNAVLLLLGLLCSVLSVAQDSDKLNLVGAFSDVLPAYDPSAPASDSGTAVINSDLGREIPVHVTNGVVNTDNGTLILAPGHAAFGSIHGAVQFTVPKGIGSFSFQMADNPQADPQPLMALYVNGDSVGLDEEINLAGEVEISFVNTDTRPTGGSIPLWVSWTDYEPVAQEADILNLVGAFSGVLPAYDPSAPASDSGTAVITSDLGREIPVHVTNGLVNPDGGALILAPDHAALGGIPGAVQFTVPKGIGTFSFQMGDNPQVDPQPEIVLYVNGDSVGLSDEINLEGGVEISIVNMDTRPNGGAIPLWVGWTSYYYVPIVPVTGIEISPAAVELEEGMDTTLTVTILPANATDTTFSWSSEKDTIASVDENGVVTALKAGATHIIATTTDGGLTAKSLITVTAKTIPVTGIEISPAAVEMEEGMDTTLTVTILPANATDLTFSWSSEKDTIASVDENGVVTALKAGTTRIIATTTDGGLTAESLITVTEKSNTGIHSPEESGIFIYPNPVRDLLYFENVSGVLQVSVMDLTGRQVKSVNNPGRNQVDLSSLMRGIYLVSLHTESGEIYSRKVIKE